MRQTSTNNNEAGNAALDTILAILIASIGSIIIYSLTAASYLQSPQASSYQTDGLPLNILLSVLLATVPMVLWLKAISNPNSSRTQQAPSDSEQN